MLTTTDASKERNGSWEGSPWMAWKTVFMDAHSLHIAISLPYFLSHNQPKALATSEGCNMVNTSSMSMYRMARSLGGDTQQKALVGNSNSFRELQRVLIHDSSFFGLH